MNEQRTTDTTPAELRLLRDAMRKQQAPAHVEALLRTRFRARRQPRRDVTPWWRVGGLAAAMAMLLLALFLLRTSPGVPEPATLASGEMTTDYLPVGYGRPLDANEFLQIIRVNVPRSEMVRLGLPVELQPGPDRVTADVVLGEDGVARAIRFVE